MVDEPDLKGGLSPELLSLGFTEPSVPRSRREALHGTVQRRSTSAFGSRGGGSRGGSGHTKKSRWRWLKVFLPLFLVIGGISSVAAFGWINYNEQVRELLGIPLPTDYDSAGNGEEVIISVNGGDTGADVARSLHNNGVTMTYEAVYDYLVARPDISFLPGNWRLQKKMSAKAAVAALQSPDNKLTDQLLLREGISLTTSLEVIAQTTGLPLDEVQLAADNPQSFGLPAEAPSLEGYLFPATYELDGTETAQEILQKLVDTMIERLDAAGVAPENRYNTLIMASIIQREAGANPDDFYKISRVFRNRIDQGINLESDATVAYGTGRFDSVWTEPEERADPANRYNTYANPGLPVGPIGLPGEQAIDAALVPIPGPWLFFVPVNLATGETVFSNTVEEHQAAVKRLFEWCDASAENASYCE
ncbi:MAG: endolytic transglycosylase MltG [Rhodoglobus sp.]